MQFIYFILINQNWNKVFWTLYIYNINTGVCKKVLDMLIYFMFFYIKYIIFVVFFIVSDIRYLNIFCVILYACICHKKILNKCTIGAKSLLANIFWIKKTFDNVLNLCIQTTFAQRLLVPTVCTVYYIREEWHFWNKRNCCVLSTCSSRDLKQHRKVLQIAIINVYYCVLLINK